MRIIGRGKPASPFTHFVRSLGATARRPFSFRVPPPFRLCQGYGGHSQVPAEISPPLAEHPVPRSLAGGPSRGVLLK